MKKQICLKNLFLEAAGRGGVSTTQFLRLPSALPSTNGGAYQQTGMSQESSPIPTNGDSCSHSILGRSPGCWDIELFGLLNACNQSRKPGTALFASWAAIFSLTFA